MKDNVLKNIGDVLIVPVSPQITGKIRFTEYSDTVVGETTARTLKREYRISPDGIFWGEWNILSNENLSSDEFITDTLLTIQVRYTRTGTDTSGEIEFKTIDFMGSWEQILFVAPTLDTSIFSNIISTPELKSLEENIFKKLYYRGILPQYITRAANSDEQEDEDFIDLFFSVSRYFSLIIRFFKRFENFQQDFDLMKEQVRQYGLYFDEATITLEDLKYLAQNMYDQIRQRGTDMIFKHKGYLLPNGDTLKIDGEFLRLVRSSKSDELLYENIPLEKVGWCLGQCSPMYRGTARSKYLNKTKEDTEDFQNLSDFVLSHQGRGNYSLVTTSDGKKVIRLNVEVGGGQTGLGRLNDSQIASDNYYVVDSKLDYEITFAFKIRGSWDKKSSKLLFGVEGFDGLKNKLNDAFITPNGDQISEQFFNNDFSNFKEGVWYFVRGIIHCYSTVNTDNVLTNLGIGNNLYFNNSFVKYMLPKIQLVSTNTASIDLWDYKIRPLVRGTDILPLKNGTQNSYSLGFIQSSRIFYAYVRNNNNSQSQEEITDIIEKYLLPYDVTDIFVFMSNY